MLQCILQDSCPVRLLWREGSSSISLPVSLLLFFFFFFKWRYLKQAQIRDPAPVTLTDGAVMGPYPSSTDWSVWEKQDLGSHFSFGSQRWYYELCLKVIQNVLRVIPPPPPQLCFCDTGAVACDVVLPSLTFHPITGSRMGFPSFFFFPEIDQCCIFFFFIYLDLF